MTAATPPSLVREANPMWRITEDMSLYQPSRALRYRLVGHISNPLNKYQPERIEYEGIRNNHNILQIMPMNTQNQRAWETIILQPSHPQREMHHFTNHLQSTASPPRKLKSSCKQYEIATFMPNTEVRRRVTRTIQINAKYFNGNTYN